MAQKNVLVVLLHGIGDCLMALPAIHALKRQMPKGKLTVMTLHRQLYHDLLKYDPAINHLLFSTLKHNPHYGHPLRFLNEYQTIKKDIAKAKKEGGYTKVYFVKMFLTPAKFHSLMPLKRYREHKADKVARELGVVLKEKKSSVKYSIKDKAWATAYLGRNGLQPQKLIGLHFTGSVKSKSLPTLQAKRLIYQLKLKGYDLLLFHDKHSYAREPEHYDSEQVTTYVSDSVLHTAALVDYCKALICVDSGVAHIAGALDKQVLVIYFKKIWLWNSLVLGGRVVSYLYKRDGRGLLQKVRSLLQA